MKLSLVRDKSHLAILLNGRSFASQNSARAEVRKALGVARLTPAQAHEVDAAVARHRQRQDTRQSQTQPQSRRFVEMQAEKRSNYAIRMGNAYHERIQSLAASRRAYVVAGRGGQGDVDHNAYAKSYGYPARWQNPGARWETIDGKHYVIIETARGREAARIQVATCAPMSKAGGWYVHHPGLLDGDLYGVLRHGVLTRYGLVRGKMVKTGVSVPITRVCEAKYGATRCIVQEWEHGESIAACQAENLRKITLRAAAWQENEMLRTGTPIQRSQIDRVTRLILRLCNCAEVRYTDARDLGYCDQGIRAWCKRRGVSADGTATFAQLRGDAMSEAVMRLVAQRQAALIISKRRQTNNQHRLAA